MRTAYLFVLFIVTGLLISCPESHIGAGTSSEQLTAKNPTALAAKQTSQESPEKVFF